MSASHANYALAPRAYFSDRFCVQTKKHLCVIYTPAISACEKGKQPDKALELLEGMQKGLEPGTITRSAAISACEMGKQLDRALELLAGMRRKGLEPDIITYTAAISACEKGKQPD